MRGHGRPQRWGLRSPPLKDTEIRKSLKKEAEAPGSPQLSTARAGPEVSGVGRLMDVRELSQALNVPVSWLYQRTRLGTIPCIRIGKYVRFDPQEVIGFLRDSERDDKAAAGRV